MLKTCFHRKTFFSVLIPACCLLGAATSFRAEFSEQVERTINTVLCAVQSLMKRREKEREGEQEAESRRGAQSCPNHIHIHHTRQHTRL